MSLPARNPRLLDLEHLKQLISGGEVDTVVIAFTDMQGRLQGKRLHAAYFLDVVVEQGTEGCNYLLSVDVDMNTVDGYAMSSWEKGYGDMEFALDFDTIRRLEHLPATVMIAAGDIDTVIVAFTDMQGRLQGKRLHAEYFLDEVLAHGTEGCNYLLAVDVDMNMVDGYKITSWESGYGDMEFVPDWDTLRLVTHLPATAMVQCDLTLMDH